MAPSGSIWHKESLKLKEIFGTREGFEICPNNFSPRPNFSPPGSRLERAQVAMRVVNSPLRAQSMAQTKSRAQVIILAPAKQVVIRQGLWS